MKDLEHARIGQKRPQVRRLVGAGGELDEMRVAVAGRKLRQAQPVAPRIEAHRLGVDGDRRAEGEALGKIALVKLNRHGKSPGTADGALEKRANLRCQ